MKRRLQLLARLAVLCPLAACASHPALHARASQPDAPPASVQPAADPVALRADELVKGAEAVEPSVTPVLVAVARELDGEMIKLEHRLKTRESTARKIRKIIAEASQPLSTARVELDDLLRYTIRFDDRPPGHYMDSCNETMRRLEARGHQIVRVKNYWPAGDNYSGIHAILRAASGLTWELQFHTSASLEVQAKTRDLYEELRREETPVDRRRELFDQMTRAWNDVAIPEGALDRKRNHQRADIVQRPHP